MSELFKKLNLKDRTRILVLDAPASFEPELAALAGVTVDRAVDGRPVQFALAFVRTRARLDEVSRELTARAEGDALLWFAYPKQSSRSYTCEFNRDTGWEVVRAAGWDSVRMVAVDADWSALRFRRSAFVKSNPGNR